MGQIDTEFTRLRHLLASDTDVQQADLVEYGELVLNLETYQASISGRPSAQSMRRRMSMTVATS